ncbi:iron chelate uptake ABC transporter family permease subunit [Streptomyces sp. NPDC056683]|uniref:iron chelate uptake ABC transporter family permease subunit n=1 Tax=Streptomyces sp. NPDC056683 TaxID=3345910 RepID=UPI0036ABF5C1
MVLRPHPRFSVVFHKRSILVALALFMGLLLAMAASACLGRTYISPADVWHTLRGEHTPYDLVVNELRVPRIVLGALVGGALGLAGALVQTVTRNPLASPDVIGVGHGAAAATVLALATGAVAAPGAMPVVAVGGGLTAAATGAAGPVGFVALTAPQLARRLTRTPQLPLVCSALTGAVVLVAADLVARTLVPPLEIPVGALTSLVGGPCLLWLLGRRQRR